MTAQVSSFGSKESVETIADILGNMRKKGVKLWSENGQLRYKAPKGALTPEEVEKLRKSRDQIVVLLNRTTGGESQAQRLGTGHVVYRAPLAFSQLFRWNLFRLSEGRRSFRGVSSAARVRGPLRIELLRMSAAEVIKRHDALRTRIVILDGAPVQEVDESVDWELKVDDLTSLPDHLRDAEVKRRIDQDILEPVDTATGPLFGLRLVRLGDDEHVLIVTLDHLISDGFSMNILLRDLFTAYTQAARGRPISLPDVPVQFAEYAVWQRRGLESWIREHGSYWTEHLTSCRAPRFPVDQELQAAGQVGWGAIPVHIGKDLKAELREWSRVRRTTLVMSVFTAYVALVLRSCDAPEAIIQYQINGRVSPKVENTIGYFASALYLRIGIRAEDTFVDLMHRVTDEYCNAYEHADFDYMAAQVPQPEFTRSCWFNWVSHEPKFEIVESADSQDALSFCTIPFASPAVKNFDWDIDPALVLFDSEDSIVGWIYFPLNRFAPHTMEKLGRNFLVFLNALLTQPHQCVKDVSLL